MARIGLWIALPLPALSVLQSWYQGQILHSRRTRSITEAVVIFLVVDGAILIAGVVRGGMTGLYVGLVAMVVSMAAQTVWLGVRSRRVRDAKSVGPTEGNAPRRLRPSGSYTVCLDKGAPSVELSHRLTTTTAFCPPNPNAFIMAYRTSARRGTLGT